MAAGHLERNRVTVKFPYQADVVKQSGHIQQLVIDLDPWAVARAAAQM